MAEPVTTGDNVRWMTIAGNKRGRVIEVHTEDVTRTVQGEQMTKHGTAENPALLIERDDGQYVFKMRREVQAAA